MKIFIGSSKEQIDNVKRVASWLENWGHNPQLWTDESTFPLGQNTWDSLITISENVDGAIFIFGEDDKTWFRDQSIMSVRDNVLLEYGLFSGKLSRDRVIFLCEGSPEISSDLLGITTTDIGKPNNAERKLKIWIDSIAKIKKNELLDGKFYITDLYQTFNNILQKNKHIHTIKIFAISTFKSVQMLRLVSNLKIDNAYILLRKYLDGDPYYEEEMVKNINIAVRNWNNMKRLGNINKLYLNYFDYHPDEGFYIIDDKYLILGILNYDAKQKESVFNNSVIFIDDETTAGKKCIKNYIERFNIIYDNCSDE